MRAEDRDGRLTAAAADDAQQGKSAPIRPSSETYFTWHAQLGRCLDGRVRSSRLVKPQALDYGYGGLPEH